MCLRMGAESLDLCERRTALPERAQPTRTENRLQCLSGRRFPAPEGDDRETMRCVLETCGEESIHAGKLGQALEP